ncbi:O-succinylhomoserine sulfhydrylase [Roseospira marina]|uniref:O-succinylhomoserine sulfhydrylase n=1 Tax=Roseospira marina TaxID=140057 RepID=A0A5M6ICW1_9PROT|nr:O-succinylhomoserine sulfhydrylase [Roseospira marina]KAA5605575.1 O-succinylhomoserine sulfhydrylase [Roseospira marina]MBB4313361.1 O-succinylhomoserine sulfhydrylase [Roseospira marina]MBB5085898.1 O-succinylhomoserine sulfhydrylase [Roseospira marina]
MGSPETPTPTPTPSADWHPRTTMVRGGLARSENMETAEALYLSSGFVYPDADAARRAFDGTDTRFVYSRFRNPTNSVFEERLAQLEGAAVCRATTSGMAAMTAALVCRVGVGDRVVASRSLFVSCHWVLTELLPRFGVTVELVPGTDLDAWRAALSRPATCVFLESPSNPGLEIIDIPAVSALAHAAGAVVIVDNAFATPVLQQPLRLGADVVIHSATKYIDGQGRCLGGAILTNDAAYDEEYLLPYLRNTGPCLSPFNAWVMAKGLETLDLRVRAHGESALALARALEGRTGVRSIRYPGLESHPQHALAMTQMNGGGGAMLALEVEGGQEGAFRFLDALRLIDISNNLGDAKSLACHPATTTHQRLSDEECAIQGIQPGLVRVSVGLEDTRDLIADVEQALAAV